MMALAYAGEACVGGLGGSAPEANTELAWAYEC